MNSYVVDASVVLMWLADRGEPFRDAALAVDRAYQAGSFELVVPHLLYSEVLHVISRRWRYSPADVLALARDVENMGFRAEQPAAIAIARWANNGLTGYDATYVALAEVLGSSVIAADQRMANAAPAHVVRVDEFASQLGG